MGRKDGIPGTLLHGLFASAACGALVGLVDAVRVEVFEVDLESHQWLVISVWYVLAAILVAVPFAFLCHFLSDHPRRWVGRAPIVGAVVFVIAALLNVLVLPDLRHPLSLAANAALLAGGLLLLRRAARRPRPSLPPAAWAMLLLASLTPPALIRILGAPEEPPPPRVVSTKENHPSVLILLVDALRRDHCSLYGYERETTPRLDAFARDALVFERARSAGPWTKPSIPSVYTGLHPSVHGVEDSFDRLPLEAVTIAELLSAGGYETLLASDSAFNSSRFRHDQGFDEVEDVFGGRFASRWRIPETTALASAWQEVVGDVLDCRWPVPTRHKVRYSAADLNGALLEWLDELRTGQKPWFAFIHYMEPHLPYDAPAPWGRRFASPGFAAKRWTLGGDRGHSPFVPVEKLPKVQHEACIAAYNGEIAYWDHCFGELIGALRSRGLLENTIVVVTADHGESFWEHETYNHANSLHDELLRVPLLIRGPGVPRARVPWAVSLESLHATLLNLVGLQRAETPRRSPAPPLLPLPTSDRLCRARNLFGGIVQQAVIEARTKWILSRRDAEVVLQCFDLDEDPSEQTDLKPVRLEEAARRTVEMLRRVTREYKTGMRSEVAPSSGAVNDALRGLGYLR